MVRGKEPILSGFIVQGCHTRPGINVPFIPHSYFKFRFGYPGRVPLPQSRALAGALHGLTPSARQRIPSRSNAAWSCRTASNAR